MDCLADVEGDAEREMENRMEEAEADDLGFLAQLRKNAKSTITSAAGWIPYCCTERRTISKFSYLNFPA